MKKCVVIFCLIFIGLSYTANFAQSRRVPPARNGKANNRDPKPAETPAPTPVVTETQPEIENQPIVDDGDVIRVDTNLVTVPVKILDRSGKFIAGLMKEDFQIFENNAQQEIAYFSTEEQPFTVALVLDMSYSSTFKIAEIQSAAFAFVSQLRPADKVMVVSFDQQVHLLCYPTNDRKVLYTAIKSTQVASGTSLYDAVDLVINERFRKVAGRKAVVLFTDGVDTTSYRAYAPNNLSDALEVDALIYPVQYDTYNDVQAIKNKPVIQPPIQNPFPVPPTSTPTTLPIPVPNIPVGTPGSQGTTVEDYRKAEEYLRDLAARTGGRVYKAQTTFNLATAFSKIAAELREYYSLGYYPKEESKAGSKRRIKVRVNRQGAAVRAREEYIVGKKK